jgi:hypothetical protein
MRMVTSPFAADALPDAAAEEAAVELEAPPQAARAPAMPAAPATFRKLLREIFIRISSIFPSCFCDVEPSLSVCAHPFSDFIVSLFFKNKMENAGLSLGKNRHLRFENSFRHRWRDATSLIEGGKKAPL